MTYSVVVIGKGEAVEEYYENYVEMRAAFYRACDLVDDEVYERAQALCDGKVDDEYYLYEVDEHGNRVEEEDWDEDEADLEMGFNPYEGAYDYDC